MKKVNKSRIEEEKGEKGKSAKKNGKKAIILRHIGKRCYFHAAMEKVTRDKEGCAISEPDEKKYMCMGRKNLRKVTTAERKAKRLKYVRIFQDKGIKWCRTRRKCVDVI